MAAVRVAPRLRSIPLLLPGPGAAAAIHRSNSFRSSAADSARAMSSSSSTSSSPSPYTTLVGRVRCEREIKRSKFIAIAASVPNERAAMSFLNEVKDPRATHNCWAYKVGEQFRYNDDGEPSSTAGKPIYSAIISSGIDMVMVVVIRYFGGIKLGTGGLVRAYGGVASECLKDAPTCLVKPKAHVGMEVPFDLLGTVYHQKGSFGAVVHLLPCDHEVMGLSPGNSLLQKCKERLRTKDPKWSDPSPDPVQAGATCALAAAFPS